MNEKKIYTFKPIVDIEVSINVLELQIQCELRRGEASRAESARPYRRYTSRLTIKENSKRN